MRGALDHAEGKEMPKRIATVGYEGLPPEVFLHVLREAGVQRVVDVRAIANSRKPGYAKRVLAAALGGAGIEYVHLPALGTPAEGRAAVRAGRPAVMRRIFEAKLAKPATHEALAGLADLASGKPTCLLCLEADPAQCHRMLIAEALQDNWNFVIQHLPVGKGE
jgi:uncharacterized protein (DUF488 family)